MEIVKAPPKKPRKKIPAKKIYLVRSVKATREEVSNPESINNQNG